MHILDFVLIESLQTSVEAPTCAVGDDVCIKLESDELMRARPHPSSSAPLFNAVSAIVRRPSPIAHRKPKPVPYHHRGVSTPVRCLVLSSCVRAMQSRFSRYRPHLELVRRCTGAGWSQGWVWWWMLSAKGMVRGQRKAYGWDRCRRMVMWGKGKAYADLYHLFVIPASSSPPPVSVTPMAEHWGVDISSARRVDCNEGRVCGWWADCGCAKTDGSGEKNSEGRGEDEGSGLDSSEWGGEEDKGVDEDDVEAHACTLSALALRVQAALSHRHRGPHRRRRFGPFAAYLLTLVLPTRGPRHLPLAQIISAIPPSPAMPQTRSLAWSPTPRPIADEWCYDCMRPRRAQVWRVTPDEARERSVAFLVGILVFACPSSVVPAGVDEDDVPATCFPLWIGAQCVALLLSSAAAGAHRPRPSAHITALDAFPHALAIRQVDRPQAQQQLSLPLSFLCSSSPHNFTVEGGHARTLSAADAPPSSS
ncbi:hypothetical protein R3P38DRAFT_3245730 [Favolaschia claudopus]|uniref:Uncharacterized protein n=1 Tax=Favolaschia claudopus TaxID=2862362 RepID=A0AAV9Z069_9AGAR